MHKAMIRDMCAIITDYSVYVHYFRINVLSCELMFYFSFYGIELKTTIISFHVMTLPSYGVTMPSFDMYVMELAFMH